MARPQLGYVQFTHGIMTKSWPNGDSGASEVACPITRRSELELVYFSASTRPC